MKIKQLVIFNNSNSNSKKKKISTLKFLKSKNNLTLQKEIKIDIINFKIYKITNCMMQKY